MFLRIDLVVERNWRIFSIALARRPRYSFNQTKLYSFRSGFENWWIFFQVSFYTQATNLVEENNEAIQEIVKEVKALIAVLTVWTIQKDSTFGAKSGINVGRTFVAVCWMNELVFSVSRMKVTSWVMPKWYQAQKQFKSFQCLKNFTKSRENTKIVKRAQES